MNEQRLLLAGVDDLTFRRRLLQVLEVPSGQRQSGPELREEDGRCGPDPRAGPWVKRRELVIGLRPHFQT